MPTPTPQHIIEQARALIAQGKSDTDIAQALNIGRATVHRIRKRDPADDATLGRRGGRKKEPSEAEGAGEGITEEYVEELAATLAVERELAGSLEVEDGAPLPEGEVKITYSDADAARQAHIQAAHQKFKAKLAERREEKARRAAGWRPPTVADVDKMEGQIEALKAEVARLERERIDLKRQAIETETAHTYALTAAEYATRAAQREVEELRAQLAKTQEDNDRLRSEEALVEAKRQRDVAHMLHVAARRVIAELEGVERARKEMDAAERRLETSREALRKLEEVL